MPPLLWLQGSLVRRTDTTLSKQTRPPAQLSAGLPVLMETLPRGAPSSGITYAVKPGPLTCEAAGLAGAHGAEQR